MFDNLESLKDNQENSLVTDRIASVFNKSESLKRYSDFLFVILDF